MSWGEVALWLPLLAGACAVPALLLRGAELVWLAIERRRDEAAQQR